MSKVFNMVGGGGKNISSIIITGLESTDTITCTKDVKSYTATWDDTAQHWEIVGLPLGTFTVNATRGTKTITETVLIDIAGVYEIEMAYKFWLYREGDECNDVTGGWGLFGNGTNAINDYDITISANSNIDGRTGAYTNNKIDFGGYTKLKMEGTFKTGYNRALILSMNTAHGGSGGDYQANINTGDEVLDSTLEVDLTSAPSPLYCQIYLAVYANGSCYGIIRKVWLE